MNKPTLDIAIITAGRQDLFDKCLDAILPQMTKDYQIRVCNNGHPSKEYEVSYKKLPSNSIIKRNNVDNGFGAGANAAMFAGKAPLILFVTDDVFLHPDTVLKLVQTMENKTIGQCGLKLLFPEDSMDNARPAGKVQHIGMGINIQGDMTHPLIGWSPDNPKCNISRDVPAVTGACFIIRRALFQAVGGFDQIYGKGYYEDMDLSMKVRSLGHRVYVNTEATATHGVGQTFKNEKTPPPLQQNQMTFKSRWMKALRWDEWEVY